MKSLGTSLPLPLKDFLSKQAYTGRGVFNNIFFFNLAGFPALLRKEFKGTVFVKGKKRKKERKNNNTAKLLNLVVFKNEKAIEQ